MLKISILHYAFFFIIYFKVEQILSNKSSPVDIRQILKDEEVIPLIIDDTPNELCTVVYENQTIIPGEFLKGLRTKNPPNVTWQADNDSYYLLFLSGLTKWLPFTKYPGQKQAQERDVEWENWVVINIPGCNVSAGDTLADYISPGYPIRDNVREKFTFFIYKQPYKYKYRTLRDHLHKAFPKKITLRNFLKMYKLTELVAVNYFHTEWDESFRITISSLRWEQLVLYNGSTTPTIPALETADWPAIDLTGIVKKFGWENFTLPPDQ